MENSDASKYPYQNEFARRYYGRGKADDVAEGKAAGADVVQTTSQRIL